MSKIKAAMIEDVITRIPRANQTKNHILTATNKIFKEAVRKELINVNPAENIERFANNPVPRDIFTSDEIKNLFPSNEEELVKVWGSLKYATFFMVLAYTGLRVGEVKALTKRDWYKNRNVIAIQKAVKSENIVGSTKNKKNRIVPVPSALDILLDKVSVGKSDNELIFPNFYGDYIGSKSYLTVFRAALKNVNIDDTDRNLVPHSLRHYFNTIARHLFKDDTLLRNITGHSDPRMTELYYHGSFEDQVEYIRPAFDKFRNMEER